MKENNRCSTLFHLLVPGGKWQTASVSPVWSARPCNSHFHRRRRQPLLPPPLAALVLIVADQFLLLGVHGNNGLACPQSVFHGAVDMPELRVAIRMIVP